MLASIFFLSFFFSSLLFAKHEEPLKNNSAILFPCGNQKTTLDFSPPPALSPCQSLSEQRHNGKLHHIERIVHAVVVLFTLPFKPKSCIWGRLHWVRLQHVLVLGSMNFANAICLWTGADWSNLSTLKRWNALYSKYFFLIRNCLKMLKENIICTGLDNMPDMFWMLQVN